MQALITLIVNTFFDELRNKMLAWFVNQAMKLLSIVEEGTVLVINNDPLLKGLGNLSQGLCWVVFGVSVLLMIVDMGEELAGLKSGQFVDLSAMLINLLKGAAFIIVAPTLALQLMNLVTVLTGALSVNYTDMKEYYSMLGVNSSLTLLVPIFMLVAIVAFFCMNLMSAIKIYIYSITAFLYIPDIVRGRTTAIGDWARPCIAVLLTYLLRHIFFMIGLVAALQGSILTMAAGWLALFIVPKALDKYGASSGFAGLVGRTASMAQSFAYYGMNFSQSTQQQSTQAVYTQQQSTQAVYAQQQSTPATYTQLQSTPPK